MTLGMIPADSYLFNEEDAVPMVKVFPPAFQNIKYFQFDRRLKLLHCIHRNILSLIILCTISRFMIELTIL